MYSAVDAAHHHQIIADGHWRQDFGIDADAPSRLAVGLRQRDHLAFGAADHHEADPGGWAARERRLQCATPQPPSALEIECLDLTLVAGGKYALAIRGDSESEPQYGRFTGQFDRPDALQLDTIDERDQRRRLVGFLLGLLGGAAAPGA